MLRRLAWALGPPILVALALTVALPDAAATADHCEPVATGSVCRSGRCQDLSRSEWLLEISQRYEVEKWLLVGLSGALSAVWVRVTRARARTSAPR